ncbi:MAG: hypothetical protein WBH85_08250, partial [Thermoanaerobaculia bacterium]
DWPGPVRAAGPPPLGVALCSRSIAGRGGLGGDPENTAGLGARKRRTAPAGRSPRAETRPPCLSRSSKRRASRHHHGRAARRLRVVDGGLQAA